MINIYEMAKKKNKKRGMIGTIVMIILVLILIESISWATFGVPLISSVYYNQVTRECIKTDNVQAQACNTGFYVDNDTAMCIPCDYCYSGYNTTCSGSTTVSTSCISSPRTTISFIRDPISGLYSISPSQNIVSALGTSYIMNNGLVAIDVYSSALFTQQYNPDICTVLSPGNLACFINVNTNEHTATMILGRASSLDAMLDIDILESDIYIDAEFTIVNGSDSYVSIKKCSGTRCQGIDFTYRDNSLYISYAPTNSQVSVMIRELTPEGTLVDIGEDLSPVDYRHSIYAVIDFTSESNKTYQLTVSNIGIPMSANVELTSILQVS